MGKNAAKTLSGSCISRWEAFSSNVGIGAVDVGARGGIKEDLRLLGNAVTWLCLEPDLDAVQDPRVNATYCPWAAGPRSERRRLNLTAQKGCSSTLEPDRQLASRFSRQHYYDLQGQVEIDVRPMDEIVDAHSMSFAFMKIDVQGMEIECFEGAKRLLEAYLLGIRTEVSFVPMYRDQPLVADIDRHLRAFGFSPARWLELHEWRRTTRVKPPRISSGPIPYSRGQLVHGDMLYLRDPEDMPSSAPAEYAQLARLAAIAACYDLFDHAYASLERPGVREYCSESTGIDPVELLFDTSRQRARRYKGMQGFLRRIAARYLNHGA